MSNKKLLNVAFFDLFTMGGGVPIVAGRLIKGLINYRDDINVILYDPFGDVKDIMQISDHNRLSIVRLEFDKDLKQISKLPFYKIIILILKSFKYIFMLSTNNKKYKPDYIIFNLKKSGLFVALSNYIYKTKIIFYFHGVQFIDDMDFVYKYLFMRSNLIVSVSEGSKKQLILNGVNENKIKRIYNALDLDYDINYDINKDLLKKELGISINSIVIGYLGNIIKRKGLDVLLKAFAIIKRNEIYRNSILIIVGGNPNEDDGKYIKYIHQLIRESHIDDSVLFLGYRNDAKRIIHAFDIFVMPSRMESFGLSIIEAMSIGLPVIATNGGSIPEIIENGYNGILVANEDYKSLAYAIMMLISNVEIRNKLSKNAIIYAKNKFALSNQVNEFIKILSKENEVCVK